MSNLATGEGGPCENQSPDIDVFLGTVSDTPLYGTLFMPRLKEALNGVDPTVLTETLVDLVRKTPVDNEAWQRYNVQAGYGERLYPNAAHAAFTAAAADPAVATEFVRMLDADPPDDMTERSALFAGEVPERILVAPNIAVGAFTPLAVWALHRVSDRATHHQLLRRATMRYGSDDLAVLRASLLENGLTEAADYVGGHVRPSPRYIPNATTLAKATVGAAVEPAFAEPDVLTPVPAPQDAPPKVSRDTLERTARDPAGVLAEQLDAWSIIASEDFRALTLAQLESLLHAASRIVVEHRVGDSEIPGKPPIYHLATAILERTRSLLLDEGVTLSDEQNMRHLQRYEEQRMVGVPEKADFWTEIAHYDKLYGLTPQAFKDLYERWSSAYAQREGYVRAQQLLASVGKEPIDYLPDGCTNVEVDFDMVTIGYSDIELLITDLARYYTPTSDPTLRAQHPELGSTIDDTQRILQEKHNQLHGPDDYVRIERMASKIRAWATTGQAHYKNLDPNLTGPSPFGDDGFVIGRTANGSGFNLAIIPRNSGASADSTERFACLHDRPVDYGTAMQIHYTADASESPRTVALQQHPGDEVLIEYAELAVPMHSILATLGRTLGTDMPDVAALARDIANVRYPGVEVILGDYRVRLLLDNVYEAEHDAESGEIKGYGRVHVFHTNRRDIKLAHTSAYAQTYVTVQDRAKALIAHAAAARTVLHRRPAHDRSIRRTLSEVA